MKILNHIYFKTSLWIITILLVTGLISSKRIIFSPELIHVNMNGNPEVQFLTKEMVIDKIQALYESESSDFRIGQINTKALEKEIGRWDYIRNVEVSVDLSNYLVIDIIQDIPLVRLIGQKGESKYLNRNLQLLPLSESYTSRIPLVTGSGADSLMNNAFLLTEKGQQMIALIRYVTESTLWSKQIAQIEINGKGYTKLYPQIGNEEIVFGYPKDLKKKFSKLLTYYREIAPKEGWNRYQQVNLTVDGQIISK